MELKTTTTPTQKALELKTTTTPTATPTDTPTVASGVEDSMGGAGDDRPIDPGHAHAGHAHGRAHGHAHGLSSDPDRV